jgi:hypothetical protein
MLAQEKWQAQTELAARTLKSGDRMIGTVNGNAPLSVAFAIGFHILNSALPT